MSKLYFDVWDKESPIGTALGELTQAYNKRFRLVHQAIGEGSFTINKNDEQAAWVGTDNVVRVRRVTGGPFAYDDSRYVGAFWIEQGDDVVLADAESGEEWTRGGRTPEVALRWAVLYHNASDSRNDQFVTHVLDDGNWHIPNRPAGEVMTIALRDAEARPGPDPLPFIDRDFTITHDSDGVPWSDSTTDWQIPVGTNYLDILGMCTSGGMFYRMGADFVFHAYEDEPGVDRSASITLVEGLKAAYGLTEAGERQVTATEAVSRVLVQGTKKNGKLVYREVVDTAVEAALPRRREGFVEYKRTPTNAKLDQAGHRYINKMKRRYDGSSTFRTTEASGKVALVNYVPGDIITIDVPGVFDEVEKRIYAIDLQEDEATGEVDPILELEQSPFDPADSRDGEISDNGGAGGSHCGDCPPLPTFCPCETAGEIETTPGGIIYEPGNGLGDPPSNLFPLKWASTGDSPGTGYAGRPRDAASFNYIGSNPNNEGWTCLVDGTLDLHIQISFIDVTGDVRTWTLELLHNGGVIAQDLYTHPGGLTVIVQDLTIDVSDLAVSAGDTLTTQFAVSAVSGPIVPAGTGSGANVFEILNTSTVGNAIPCVPLEGQQHVEELTGQSDDVTTVFQTNFPYVCGSTEVHVNGLLTPVEETDPENGYFTFLDPPPTDAVIIVRYQNAGTTPTGADNPFPEPSTPTGAGDMSLDDLNDVVITSPVAGDQLRFDGTNWVNSTLRWSPIGVNAPTLVTTDGLAIYTMLTTSDGDPILAEVP